MGSFTSSRIYERDGYGNIGDRYMYVTVTQTKGTSSENKSTINWTIYSDGASYWADTGPTTLIIGGVERYSKARTGWSTGAFPAANGSVSGSFTVNHNNDGSASNLSVSLSTAINTGTVSSVSGTLTMDKIDRYFSSTPTISLTNRTETSMNFSWSTSETCTKVICYYKLSTASSWTNVTKYNNSTGTTSGTFSLTGLTAGKTYNIYIKATRKDSGLTSDSDTGNYLTYDYPYIKSILADPLVIGNQQTVTIYNPLGRSIVFYMKQNNTSGTTLYTHSSWNPGSGENITFNFTPTASTLYSSIPNSQSGNAVYYCTYSSVISPTKNGTYQIIGSEVPTMPGTMFTFSEGNNTVQNVTGGVGFVQLLSTVNALVTNMPTGQNNATISNCVVTIEGSNQQSITGTNQVISWVGLNFSGQKAVTVTATDSRGLTNTATWNITFYPYAYPSISGAAARINNYGTDVTITAFYSSSPVMINNVKKNGIKIQYSGASQNGYLIGSSSNFGTAGEGNISTNLANINNSNSYSFTFTITDKFNSTKTVTANLPIGMPLMFVDSEQQGIGINKFPGFKGIDIEGELKISKGLVPVWKMTLPTTNAQTYYKVASGTMNTAENLNLTFFVQHGGNPHWLGICAMNLRSDGTTVSINSCKWLTKIGIASTKFRVCVSGKVWTLYLSKNAGDSGTYYITELSRRNENGNLPTDAIVYTTAVEASSDNPPTGSTANLDSSLNMSDFYPVGSVYITTSQTSPASLFGGTWAHINSRFLYSASSESASTTSTGGSSTRTLSASNIPQHTHSIPALTGTAESAGGHSHVVTRATTSYASGSQSSWRCLSWAGTSHDYSDVVSSESAGAHTHTVTTDASTTGSYGGNSSGNTASFSILPPYFVVHIWRRTA